jgi:hypothetical protein
VFSWSKEVWCTTSVNEALEYVLYDWIYVVLLFFWLGAGNLILARPFKSKPCQTHTGVHFVTKALSC